MDTETAPLNTGIGGNNPPDPIEILLAHLRETYVDYLNRAAELLAVGDRLPAEMDDDWEAKLSEQIKACTKFVRNSEVTRLAANEPHRALIAATDGFFKKQSDLVEALKTRMNAEYLSPYQRRKKDEEQRRRDAAAAEAKRIADEAAEAERVEARRLAAIKKAEDDARAERERIEREEREAAEREERDRQRRAREAAEAKSAGERAAAAAAQREADEKAAAERKKRDDEAAKIKAEQDRLEAQRKEQEDAERRARDEAAEAAQADNKARESAAAKAADMSRTRSTLGAVASLRTTWHFEVVNEDAVPREYLLVNASKIGGAVRGATKKDGTNDLVIPGVRIYSKTDSVVR